MLDDVVREVHQVVEQGLTRILIRSGKREGYEEAQRRMAAQWPVTGEGLDGWLDLLEDKLSDEEKTIVRWARNARIGKGGGGTPAERHRATAFEALLGYLYLSGRSTRLQELLDLLTTNQAPGSGG